MNTFRMTIFLNIFVNCKSNIENCDNRVMMLTSMDCEEY